jgi:C1A family cysteine protease
LAVTTFRAPHKKLESVPAHVQEAFQSWMGQQNKKYTSPSEQAYRLRVFSKTYANIAQTNAAQSDYVLGLNKFSDLTEEEFVAKYTGLKIPKNYKRNIVASENKPIANDIDWRTKGAVNHVKDQANCGSCWAFSATAAIEGAWQIDQKQLLDLSEQQMVDCSKSQGNQGCNGGWMDYAFVYIQAAGGQMKTSDYPYTARDGTCHFSASKVAAKVTGYKDVPKGDCKTLLSFADQGPTSVAIAANAIMSYKSGIFSNAACGVSLNHGVTLVGYGTESSKPFYIVRNSWGAGWGEAGYIRMARDVQPGTGICGICQASSSPKA